MGAKASTANGDDASARERSFSTGSASDVVASSAFNLLHSLPNLGSTDRQRARSLSSVPDGHENVNRTANSSEVQCEIETIDTESNSTDDRSLDSPLGTNIGLSLGLGRVYTARSLPSHIWSLNGIKCPVCSKFVLPDDVECHLVMCLTKPRLTYNEDVLTNDKGECVICLEDLLQGDTIARLPCLCVYHKSCIDQWFDVNRSCPEHPGD
ncbi:E3 ubiquitin-protein ligase ZNRF1 [Planococcus citri]|uniref:E3 ubiquitin-protein ligase ZNRF1 n=1 Tax=Planococcus citri TaxID=170843 RepID=UPI0031FA107B